jgi:hypothetical protein
VTDLAQTAEGFHDLAIPYALCGREREALDALDTAIRLDYPAEIVQKEKEFKELANNARFKKITAAKPGKVKPSAGG